MPEAAFTVRIRHVIAGLALPALLLAGLNVPLMWLEYRLQMESPAASLLVHRFTLSGHDSLLVWFSAGLLLLIAGLLAATGSRSQRLRNIDRRHWLLLSLLAVAASMNEMTRFVELLTGPLSRFIGDLPAGALAAIVLPGAVLGAWHLRFLRRQSRRLRSRLLLSEGLLLTRTVMEASVIHAVFERHGAGADAYILLATLSGTFWLSGLILLTQTLLQHLSGGFDHFRLRLSGAALQDVQGRQVPAAGTTTLCRL